MNQQSHDQPGLAQPGPAQRDLGHPTPEGPSRSGGAELKDAAGDAAQGAAQGAGAGAHAVTPKAGEPAENASRNSDVPADKSTGVRNEAVVGPFTVRDVTVFAATLVLFVASLVPMFSPRYNLWNLGSLFFLGLGIVLPLLVSALFVARRLAPETKVRIGSLSIDQFGSVVASFSVAFFFLASAEGFTPFLLVALIGSLVLLAATVLARLIPFFAGDFLDRAEVPAHVMARESTVPVRKPRPAKAPKAAKPAKAADAKPSLQSPTAAGHYAAGQTSGGRTAGSAAAAGTPGTAGAAGAAGAQSAATPGAGAPAGVVGAASAGAWSASSSAAAAPATEAAAVVPSAAETAAERRAVTEPASPAEETQLDGVPVASAAAPADKATAAVPAEEARAASATPATAVHPQVKAHEPVRSQEPIGATVDPSSRPEESEQPVHEAFWFAVAQHRTAVDERTGAPLFGIEPGGWVLALEDRGDEFLVQHTDGRVGVLRDLSNIERG
ncbi:hypothetical protein [Arthrobacter sp. NPDC093139]|uniref:hypothetical protein n=1 Tax=Arthrobacter sp. NPDC093139 TaxID=3363945 RepID=UPI0037F25FAA